MCLCSNTFFLCFKYETILNTSHILINTPNTKHQTPNTKHQTPNTKHQTPNTKPNVRTTISRHRSIPHDTICTYYKQMASFVFSKHKRHNNRRRRYKNTPPISCKSRKRHVEKIFVVIIHNRNHAIIL